MQLRKFIRETLLENKLYPASIEASITKRLNDNSDELKNLIAIFGLFRQQRPFNQVGDINKIQSRDELQKLYDTWLEQTIKELIKTREFLDNKELAIKFITAYKDNVRKLGQQARPFSVKNVEKELIDVVNNNKWVKEKVTLAGATSIYSPAESDVIYKDEDIWIVRGDTKAKCVNYGAGKSWCITKADQNQYTTYRINYGATIFFCMQPKIKGDEHTFVLMNYGNGKYAIADETNKGSRHGGPELAMTWSKVEREIPNLMGKEGYFKYVPVSGDEKEYSKLVSRHYDEDDLGDYVLRVTKDLVVNGGIIAPADFIRDYVAHGHNIINEQFQSLNDEMKNSLIETGMYLTDWMFNELNDAQKRRYIVVMGNGNRQITQHMFFSIPVETQKEYVLKLSHDELLDMYQHFRAQEDLFDVILSSGIHMDSHKLGAYIRYSNIQDNIINTLLSNDVFTSNINQYVFEKLSSSKKHVDKLINLLKKLGDSFISNLFFETIDNLIKHTSSPIELMKVLKKRGVEYIQSLNTGQIELLMYFANNKKELEMIISQLGSKESMSETFFREIIREVIKNAI